jgi:hypothetical protein
MRTRIWNGSFDIDELAGEVLVERSEADRPQHRRSRAAKPAKRRSSRAAGSHPDLGMSARRNRRWSW